MESSSTFPVSFIAALSEPKSFVSHRLNTVSLCRASCIYAFPPDIEYLRGDGSHTPIGTTPTCSGHQARRRRQYRESNYPGECSWSLENISVAQYLWRNDQLQEKKSAMVDATLSTDDSVCPHKYARRSSLIISFRLWVD